MRRLQARCVTIRGMYSYAYIPFAVGDDGPQLVVLPYQPIGRQRELFDSINPAGRCSPRWNPSQQTLANIQTLRTEPR